MLGNWLAYSSLVAERVKHVERIDIALLASPYKVDPRWEILAHVAALQGLQRDKR